MAKELLGLAEPRVSRHSGVALDSGRSVTIRLSGEYIKGWLFFFREGRRLAEGGVWLSRSLVGSKAGDCGSWEEG